MKFTIEVEIEAGWSHVKADETHTDTALRDGITAWFTNNAGTGQGIPVPLPGGQAAIVDILGYRSRSREWVDLRAPGEEIASLREQLDGTRAQLAASEAAAEAARVDRDAERTFYGCATYHDGAAAAKKSAPLAPFEVWVVAEEYGSDAGAVRVFEHEIDALRHAVTASTSDGLLSVAQLADGESVRDVFDRHNAALPPELRDKITAKPSPHDVVAYRPGTGRVDVLCTRGRCGWAYRALTRAEAEATYQQHVSSEHSAGEPS